MRRWGAQKGLGTRLRADARVMSVGNIQAGGAGKTPLVAQLVNEGAAKNYRIWILTRGYRGQRENVGGVIEPSLKPVSAQEWGDEAALLHDLCPQAWIGVGRNRVQQYCNLLQTQGRSPDLVILDDGFQNHQFVKDVEIVALTSARTKDTYFRDSWSALDTADLLIWTKGEILPEFARWQAQKPWAHVQFELTMSPSDQALWMITGIAGSQQAHSSALQSGYRVVKKTALADHFAYTGEQIQRFLSEAEQEGVRVAVTGKDWVKWRELGAPREKVTVLEPQLRWVYGRENWEKVVWATSF